jgi:hypothetical protein
MHVAINSPTISRLLLCTISIGTVRRNEIEVYLV